MTILLIVIYIAFIGLGIPDSLFGTAWPAIYMELGLPFSFGSVVTVLISAGTVLSSLLSPLLIRRFSTGRLTAFSTALTAASLIGFSFSDSLIFFCLLALPLGIGAGAVDTALNNYISLHYSASHMSFLHCFYGIGVSLSPYLMSLIISSPSGWRGGYQAAFMIQIFITLLLFAALPLWKKADSVHPHPSEENVDSLSLRRILNIPGVISICCVFITSCGIEYTCGSWGSTFLVEYRNLPFDTAARIIMFYYIGMTLGRFISGLLSCVLHSWQIIRIGQCLLGISILFLIIPAPPFFAAVGLFLIGLGNGPLFPNLNYLTPQNFGADVSPSVMGIQMAASYIGIMLVPALFGFLGQALSPGIFPFYLLLFYIGMIVFTKKGRNDTKKSKTP